MWITFYRKLMSALCWFSVAHCMSYLQQNYKKKCLYFVIVLWI